MTTQAFIIKKFENQLIVVGLTHERLDFYLSAIRKDMKRRKFHGTLMLDLLISNGNNSRRFYEINFDGTCFDYTSIRRIVPTNTRMVDSLNSFFLSNQILLENGALSSEEVRRFIDEGSYSV